MKIEGKLLEKLANAGINIEELERESHGNEDGVSEKIKYDIAKFPRARDFVPVQFSDRIEEDVMLSSNFEHYKYFTINRLKSGLLYFSSAMPVYWAFVFLFKIRPPIFYNQCSCN